MTPPPVVAVVGPTATGKTALAVRWARRCAGRFPDGLLYFDLRGFDPRPPLSTQDALERLLAALGVTWSGSDAGTDGASTVDDMVARYHRAIAGRRMLVVLDEFTRRNLAIVVARRLRADDVLQSLSDLFVAHGPPEHIRSDNVLRQELRLADR